MQKNLKLILPMLLGSLIHSALKPLEIDFPSLFFLNWLVFELFIPCLINIYLIVYLFKFGGVLLSEDSTISLIKKHYKNGLWLYLLGGLFSFLIVSPFFVYLRLTSTDPEYSNLILLYFTGGLFSFLLMGSHSLALCCLIYIKNEPYKAFVAGLKELKDGFSYYLLLVLINYVVSYFPSFLFLAPSSFSANLQLAEYYFYQEENLLSVIFSVAVKTWFLISITYVFLYRKNNLKFQPLYAGKS